MCGFKKNLFPPIRVEFGSQNFDQSGSGLRPGPKFLGPDRLYLRIDNNFVFHFLQLCIFSLIELVALIKNIVFVLKLRWKVRKIRRVSNAVSKVSIIHKDSDYCDLHIYLTFQRNFKTNIIFLISATSSARVDIKSF